MTDLPLTDPAVATFIVIPVMLVALLVWATARAYRGRKAMVMAAVVDACATAWMAGTWIAASTGVIGQWDRTPPPLAFLATGIVALAGLLAWSSLGRRLVETVPLWALVLVQAFRLPLEIAMHTMYERGVMPVQMSYSGRNFDIITGGAALVVAYMARSPHARPVVYAWNVMGLLLVINVATLGILSTPRFRYFGDAHLNTWIADAPFVWLPAVMVLAAVAGHLLIFRALSSSRNRTERADPPT